jgi:uncharacterized delta-60 repeat protein
VVRPDGKIVADGFVVHHGTTPDSIGLVRILPGGGLDTSFSGDGRLTSSPLAQGVGAGDLELVTGNKLIVAAGAYTSPFSFFLARYQPGGALDSTFGGGDGFVLTQFPGTTSSGDFAYGSAIQANGKILVAGYSSQTTGNFAVSRYLP